MIGPRTRRVRCSGESASRPRTGVRPVLLDDLHGELPRGEEVRRGAVAGGALEAEVEEGEKDGVLVGGGEAALVEESEDALGERQGGVRIDGRQDAFLKSSYRSARKSAFGLSSRRLGTTMLAPWNSW